MGNVSVTTAYIYQKKSKKEKEGEEKDRAIDTRIENYAYLSLSFSLEDFFPNFFPEIPGKEIFLHDLSRLLARNYDAMFSSADPPLYIVLLYT